MVLHEKFTPFGTCRCGAVFLAFAAARSPKANPARDRALGEVADWLMHAGSRCWLGPPNPPDATVSLVRFTQRVARLKIALDLPNAIPRWAAVSDASLWDPSTVAVIACGSARMQGSDPDLQGTGIQWLDERHAHPYAWQVLAGHLRDVLVVLPDSLIEVVQLTHGRVDPARQIL